MSQIDLPTDFDFQQAGRQVLEIEREGLAQLDQYINEDFTHACETIFRCGGKVVVMGMGKSICDMMLSRIIQRRAVLSKTASPTKPQSRRPAARQPVVPAAADGASTALRRSG